MDGIEWQRKKWSFWARSWLYVNEKIGCKLGTHLVADHPEIKKHLAQYVSRSKITVIPYGSETLVAADEFLLTHFNLEKERYALVIARPEPENSILEIVRAYSKTNRGVPLVILGDYTPSSNVFHQTVFDAASDEVKFVGSIYDKKIVQALRFYARFYIHGHTVGGTNPSLVEALGAGTPILAHKNRFNHWVAGEGAFFFTTEKECEEYISLLIRHDDIIPHMRLKSFEQMRKNFTWNEVNHAYKKLLSTCFE